MLMEKLRVMRLFLKPVFIAVHDHDKLQTSEALYSKSELKWAPAYSTAYLIELRQIQTIAAVVKHCVNIFPCL